MFEEQVGWAAEAGVDYVIAETFSYAEEARMAVEAIKEAGLPAVATLIVHQEPETRDGLEPGRRVRSARAGGRGRRRAQLRPRPAHDAPAPPAHHRTGLVPGRGAARSVPDDAGRADVPGAP